MMMMVDEGLMRVDEGLMMYCEQSRNRLVSFGGELLGLVYG